MRLYPHLQSGETMLNAFGAVISDDQNQYQNGIEISFRYAILSYPVFLAIEL